MSNITKYTPQTLAINLTQEERWIVKAMKAERIMDIPDKLLLNYCVDLISLSYTLLGQTAPGSSGDESAKYQLAMSSSLAKDLKEYFGTLTIEEVKIAISRGVRRYYGDFYGINVASLHGFVRSYKASFDREEAIRKQLQHERELDGNVTPTDQQKERMMIEFCDKAFDDYILNGSVTDYGSAKYDFLKSKGAINLTEERKDQIREIATKNVTAELERTKQNAYGSTGRQLIELFKQSFKSRVNAEAKRIALQEYFDFLITTEEKPSQHLESLQNEGIFDVKLKQ